MSWKTSVFGLMAAVGGAVMVALQTGMIDVGTLPPWVKGVAGLLSVVGTAGIGFFARDNNKTSEQVGAGKEGAGVAGGTGGLVGLLFLFWFGVLCLVMAGCASWNTQVQRTEQTMTGLAYTSYVGYTNALQQGVIHPTADQSNTVRQARLKFAATVGTLESLRASYETNSAVKPQVQALLVTAGDESSNVVWLVQYLTHQH